MLSRGQHAALDRVASRDDAAARRRGKDYIPVRVIGRIPGMRRGEEFPVLCMYGFALRTVSIGGSLVPLSVKEAERFGTFEAPSKRKQAVR